MGAAWSYKQMGYTFGQAMMWLRQLVTGFSPWRLRFDSREAHLGFVLDKVQIGQVFFLSNSVVSLSVSFHQGFILTFHSSYIATV
jgi:hypothetical protein